MKYLFLLFLSFNSFGEQEICLSKSELIKVMNNEPGAGAESCEKGSSSCICRPIGKDWHELKLDGDKLVDDNAKKMLSLHREPPINKPRLIRKTRSRRLKPS